MARVFCPRCRAEVDNVEGFCLLGHRLPDLPADDPIVELRQAVEAAFTQVEVDVKALSSVVRTTEVAPAPQVEAPDIFSSLAPEDTDDNLHERMLEAKRDVWAELTKDKDLALNDPIVGFAPSPRMDWGPERRRRGTR